MITNSDDDTVTAINFKSENPGKSKSILTVLIQIKSRREHKSFTYWISSPQYTLRKWMLLFLRTRSNMMALRGKYWRLQKFFLINFSFYGRRTLPLNKLLKPTLRLQMDLTQGLLNFQAVDYFLIFCVTWKLTLSSISKSFTCWNWLHSWNS